MAQDLTPQQIAAVMAARNARTQDEYNAILQAAGLTGAPLEYRESQTYSQDGVDNQRANPLTRQITQQINGSASNTWDPVTGKYTGLSSGMSEAAQTLMALTMLAGGAYGAYAAGGGAGAGAAGAAGAGGTAGGAAGGAAGGTAGGTAGGLVTLTPAEIAATNTAATAGLGGQVMSTLPAISAGGGVLGAGLTAAEAASAAKTAADMGSKSGSSGSGDWMDTASKFLGNNAGGLLGGLAGYLDSKDKQQTQSRDPWAPMQPYLLGLANDGAGIYNQLKQQPFSQSQQTAYGNVGNVLDFINSNAGSLMSGFNANASGANQFSRNNPRRSLIGNSYDPGTSPVAWQPGLLSSFGTKKG